jgi:hypothetical protein
VDYFSRRGRFPICKGCIHIVSLDGVTIGKTSYHATPSGGVHANWPGGFEYRKWRILVTGHVRFISGNLPQALAGGILEVWEREAAR